MALAEKADTIINTYVAADGKVVYSGVRVQAFLSDVEQQLYSDASGTPVSLVQTDANGLYSFWIEEGTYNLRFSVGGVYLGGGDYLIITPVSRTEMGGVVERSETAAARSEAAAQNALNYGNAAIRSGYVAADAEAWTAGAWVQVLSSDTGTHASKAGDFGASGGQTPNAGVYQEDATLGLIRKAELESSLTAQSADDALAAAGLINDKLSTISDRSGYLGGWFTPSGLMALGFTNDNLRPIFGNGGDVVTRIEMLELLGTIMPQGRSGVLGGVIFPNGSMPIAYDSFEGRVSINGRSVALELDNLAAQIAAITGGILGTPDYPSDDVFALGDSLSGPGSSGDWPTKLAGLRGVQVYTGGVGGQGSGQIAARGNGVPVRFTAAFVLPADTAAVAVTTTYYTPCSASTSQNITVLGVPCVLTRTGSDQFAHTLARSASASSTLAVPAGTMGLSAIGAAYRGRTLITCTGRNSLPYAGSPMSIPQIIATIRAQINYQDAKVKRAIVWGIPPLGTETIGTANRTILDSYNSAQASAFPEHWLDIPAWLRTTAPVTVSGVTVNDPFTVLGITPTSQDLTDIANGITPLPFNASSSDRLHFSPDGGTAIAYRMDMELKLRGSN